MRTHHIQYTLKKQDEVRHLLIDLTAGAGAASLSELTNAVETPIATGTQSQMEEKARALAQDWAANEGFEFPKEDQPVFDSLKNTITLAALMGLAPRLGVVIASRM